MTDAPRRYEFAGFVLDLGRGALQKDGADLPLRPKAFAVLRLLVERHGQLVTKDDLLEAVWRPAVVTEGALTQCIIEIRRALGDAGATIVRTVPRRGYMLDVPVSLLVPRCTTEDVPATRRSAASATLSAAPAPGAGPAADSVPDPLSSAAMRGELPAEAPGVTRRTALRTARYVLAAAAVAAALAAAWPMLRAPADRVPPDAQALQPSTTAGGAAGAAPVTEPASIAVLPFTDLSPGHDQAYFSDGLSEEILDALSATPGLRVIARTSSFALRGEKLDAPAIGRRLNAAHLLDGSVRREGDRVRISARLVETAAGTRMWSATYDRNVRDVLEVQSEIAAAVTRELVPRLTASAMPGDVASRDPRAILAVRQGRYLFNRRGDGDLERAERQIRFALSIEPEYGRAWAALAAVLLQRAVLESDPESPAVRDFGAAVERALALAPDYAESHVRAAMYRNLVGDRAGAARHFERARALRPDDPLVLGVLAGQKLRDGDPEEAVRLAQQVVRSDPLSAVAHVNLSGYLSAAGRFEESHAQLRVARDLAPNSHGDDDVMQAKLLIVLQRPGEALRMAERWPEGADRDLVVAASAHALGRSDLAGAALRRLESGTTVEHALALAEVRAYLRDVDGSREALHVLQSRLEGSSRSERIDATTRLRVSPLTREARQNAGWIDQLAAAGPRRPPSDG